MSKINKGILTLDTPIVDSENGYTIVNVDLNKLAKERIAQDSDMEGIKLNKAFTPFKSNKNNNMVMKFNIEYNDDTESLTLVGKNLLILLTIFSLLTFPVISSFYTESSLFIL